MTRTIAATLLAFAIAAPARADVIFSNLGPGDSYACCTGWTVYGSGAPVDTDRASPFVPVGNYTLDSIELALQWSSGTNSAIVFLMEDAGNVPGAGLEAFFVSNLPAFGTTSTSLTLANSTSHPLLLDGVQYWVAVSAFSDGLLSFNTNIIGDEGLASRDNNGPWGNNGPFAAGALRVNGTPAVTVVPEPASVLLIGTGVLGLITKRARRRV